MLVIMVRYILILSGFFVLLGCSSQKGIVISDSAGEISDSTQYEIIISEPGYDSWVATNRKPIWYHSHEYYQNFNKLYVNEWNHRATVAGYDFPYDYQIDYNIWVDYGLEVDYKLFWYFKFVQDKYDIKLLSTENR